VDVDIEFCDEVMVHEEHDRREVAVRVQSIIVSKYKKIPLPEGEVSPYAGLPEAT
jgi:hypothetical protein